ncbi:E3 ubiquitin-protein ligase PRT6 [Quillaja saponaria]|uniref:E3 ubiquitin-protein ligase n=1 Tax=Quillaja saponaria TaxID=32244 RepID=A0AAD7LR14_QUISA|nr:E3 ubiquitin-protein ligase PRT6 [Quillaja saponaria]
MNPQKREAGLHIEENENVHFPFFLCNSIANIHSLLVDGAFSDVINGETDDEILLSTCEQDRDDGDSLRHAKVGRLSQESSACSAVGRSSAISGSTKGSEIKSDAIPHLTLPSSVTWLTYECLKAIENWLGVDNTSGLLSSVDSSISESNFSAFKRTLSKITKGNLESSKSTILDEKMRITGEIDSVKTCNSTGFGDSAMEGDCVVEMAGLRFLSLSNWPEIDYDCKIYRILLLLIQCQQSIPTSLDILYGVVILTGFSGFVMEHPLRIRVFCAGVHAGMWRKNGDAALLCCEWSEQGMEHDLFLLQCCAALAPADLYVSRILERFGLSTYLTLNLEQSSEYEAVLVHEMLTLIIQIVKERRFCGLSTAESLKRELIYKLAIGDATHSQLVKSLPRDLSKFEQLQEILDTVAVYSKPSGFNQGMYSLRRAFWNELDLYHPRWNLKDLQVAEERYLRFCSVSALTTQLPGWTTIYPPLKGVARIATCKVVLQIIRAVLFYAVFTFQSSESRAPDSVLLTALHLLSLALDICFQQRESSEKTCNIGESVPIISFSCENIYEGLNYGVGEQSLLSLLVLLMRMHKKETLHNIAEAGGCDLSSLVGSLLKKFAEIDAGCMSKLQQLAPEVVSDLLKHIANSDSITSGSASDSEKRKAKARERQAAILEKMRAQQSKFLANISSIADDDSQASQEGDDSDVDIEESTEVCCLCHDHNSKDTISFLTLLQKSRLVSFVDRGHPSWQELCLSDQERASVSQSIVTDISEMNTSSGGLESPSSSQFVQFFQNVVNELASCGPPGDVTAFLEYVKDRFPALRNVQVPDTSNNEWERTSHTPDTLEQEVYFSIHKEMDDYVPCSISTNVKSLTDGGDLNKRTADGSILLSKYVAALSKEMTENPLSTEIILSDHASVLSSSHLPTCDGLAPPDCDGVHLSSCGHAVHQRCLNRYLSSLKERSVRRIVFEGGHIVDPDQGEFLCPVCRRLVNSVLPTLPGELEKVVKQPKSLSVGPIHAASPSTTASQEINTLCFHQAFVLLQSAAKVVGRDDILKAFPLKQDDRTGPNVESFCQVLSKMYFPAKQDKSRASKLSHTMLMWDTLKYSLMTMEIAARCGRTSLTPNHALNALYDELRSSSGFILSMLLKVVQKARLSDSLHVLQRFRGIQFFAESICSGISMDNKSNGISDRGGMIFILRDVQNEISSLDIQFWNRASDPVLAHDPFSSLMWLLYCLPYPFLSCETSLLSLVHVFYIVSVAQAIFLYFGKNQNNLREFGLSDCMVTDIYKDNVLDGSWNAINDMKDSTTVASVELSKVQELENTFKIPLLDVVLNDEEIRSLVLKWSHHLCKEFRPHTRHRIMHVSPAVPFQLMRLPHVYQDLLQRYIKQRCPECKTVLDEPALCLLCGKLCTPRWKSCCRESGCQTHATACGAGTGVFLLIRRTTILLQRAARLAPWPSPYLDSFGEEDFEMHRGKPLYLNEERYASLTYMVASHGLDRSSKVLGQTTTGSFFMV